ncbi:polysaccharide deacetylase family protein [Flavobacterium amniphilum]|uniref:polysaccharide deacetylase family protein n=1 Tax=Flavobacterium amniphilum TaxID=1834035 RepID=UPI00202A17AE|nr:polysaccharide deacetylase family protein [Flavobacterium amniphilum]MCL9806015.1 polysaccharide deacetylase family protein [Flavobacterium amniphilum]
MVKLRFLLLLLFVSNSFGQMLIAKIDRSVWPYPMNSKADFDVASKMEMLVFSEVLNEYSALNQTELFYKIGVKNLNVKSIRNWEAKTKNIILDNFNQLLPESLPTHVSVKKNMDWNTLTSFQLEKKIPENLKKWYQASRIFHEDYLVELYRLAALNPRITSEIAAIDGTEVNGDDFKQRHFLLTFDDGPTPATGNTDKMISVLNTRGLKGLFFVLGDNFNQRLNASSAKALQNLYEGHVVASHAKVHKSHQKFTEWQASLDFTQKVIKSVKKSDKLVYFRPPYGQRNKTVVDYVNTHQSKVVLWNMDSQDWNKDINAKEVASRQITLMLLWRKGILLFHDVHSKAQTAVPLIHDYFKKADVIWIDPNSAQL